MLSKKLVKDKKITLYNRATRALEEEVVFERWFMDLFYGTTLGYWLTAAVLKRHFFSHLYGFMQRLPSSRGKIAPFIARHQINADEFAQPVASFRSFNEFFLRRLKPEVRPIQRDPRVLISPADARCLWYEIEQDTALSIKGVTFTLAELVGQRMGIQSFIGGCCLVLRLAPADYHHFCYIDQGAHGEIVPVNGFLHSVHPLALQRCARVLPENYRELCVLHTEHFGDVLEIDIGAMVVGKMVQHQRHGGVYERGQEKGYFEFGGSTIVLVFRRGAIRIAEEISAYSRQGIETIVRYGAAIGERA